MVNCEWCAGKHAGKCPLVSAIEYYPGGVGVVKRVEFHRPGTVPLAAPSPGLPPEQMLKRWSKEHFDPLRPAAVDAWLTE